METKKFRYQANHIRFLHMSTVRVVHTLWVHSSMFVLLKFHSLLQFDKRIRFCYCSRLLSRTYVRYVRAPSRNGQFKKNRRSFVGTIVPPVCMCVSYLWNVNCPRRYGRVSRPPRYPSPLSFSLTRPAPCSRHQVLPMMWCVCVCVVWKHLQPTRWWPDLIFDLPDISSFSSFGFHAFLRYHEKRELTFFLPAACFRKCPLAASITFLRPLRLCLFWYL